MFFFSFKVGIYVSTHGKLVFVLMQYPLMQIRSQHQYQWMKWNIYWNAKTASLVISLTLMAYMHKMWKTYNNNNIYVARIKNNMLYNYVYS